MILIDANLPIYSSTVCLEQENARNWLDGQIFLLQGVVSVHLYVNPSSLTTCTGITDLAM